VLKKALGGFKVVKKLNKWCAAATLLLVISVSFAMVASAESPKQTYQEYKEKYTGAKNTYLQAKQEFENSKANYQAAKNKENSEALLNSIKNYAIKTIDVMIAYLEVIKASASLPENQNVAPYDILGNIDRHIAELEQDKLVVQSATNESQLLNVSKSIKDTWQSARLEVKYYTGYLAKNRIETFLNKSKEVSARVDSQIQILKSNGTDTAKLEDGLAAYNDWMSNAEEKYNAIKDNYKTHGGFDANGQVTNLREANQFITIVNQNLKEARQNLKNAKDNFKDTVTQFRASNLSTSNKTGG
jgi:hypothetical protein